MDRMSSEGRPWAVVKNSRDSAGKGGTVTDWAAASAAKRRQSGKVRVMAESLQYTGAGAARARLRG